MFYYRRFRVMGVKGRIRRRAFTRTMLARDEFDAMEAFEREFGIAARHVWLRPSNRLRGLA